MKKKEAPIVFFVYRKKDVTKKIFEKIRENKPSNLYIISDGAKGEKDYKDVMDIRNYIDSHLDWNCDVKKIYRGKNYGLRYGIPDGLDYVFSKEEKAIIIEDDIDFSMNFIDYCNVMLDKYENNDKVMVISGHNPYNITKGFGEYDICFSNLFSIWGWATWKRAWQKYENNIPRWCQLKRKRNFFDYMTKSTFRYYNNIFNDLQFQWYNSWGYQWKFAVWINKGLVIIPKYNYIKNIGMYEEFAEHKENKEKIEYIISVCDNVCSSFPNTIKYNKEYDKVLQTIEVRETRLLEYVKSNIRAKIHLLCRNITYSMEKDSYFFLECLGDECKLSKEFQVKNYGRKYKENSAEDLRNSVKKYIKYKIIGEKNVKQ